ncbi:hypothetical protein [Streptomyces sp. B6B3]|uniref:hypothetical protein n=1 Tax=Streptomyces sp. B6B3 TaxID=3153570 RepID=UPI00325F0509
MRSTSATWAEVDAWLVVLHRRGHVDRVEPDPDGTWTVRRRQDTNPRTLHHPVLAMDWIEELLRDIQRRGAETSR